MQSKVNIRGYHRAKVFVIIVACSVIFMAIYRFFESISA